MNNDRLNMGANNPCTQSTSLYHNELERLQKEVEESYTTVQGVLKIAAKPVLKCVCVACGSLAALCIVPLEEMSVPLNIAFASGIIGLNIGNGVMQVLKCDEGFANYERQTDKLREKAIQTRNNIAEARLLQ